MAKCQPLSPFAELLLWVLECRATKMGRVLSPTNSNLMHPCIFCYIPWIVQAMFLTSTLLIVSDFGVPLAFIELYCSLLGILLFLDSSSLKWIPGHMSRIEGRHKRWCLSSSNLHRLSSRLPVLSTTQLTKIHWRFSVVWLHFLIHSLRCSEVFRSTDWSPHNLFSEFVLCFSLVVWGLPTPVFSPLHIRSLKNSTFFALNLAYMGYSARWTRY